MDSSNACAQAGFSRISRVGTGGHGDVDLDDFAGIEACLLGPGDGWGRVETPQDRRSGGGGGKIGAMERATGLDSR